MDPEALRNLSELVDDLKVPDDCFTAGKGQHGPPPEDVT